MDRRIELQGKADAGTATGAELAELADLNSFAERKAADDKRADVGRYGEAPAPADKTDVRFDGKTIQVPAGKVPGGQIRKLLGVPDDGSTLIIHNPDHIRPGDIVVEEYTPVNVHQGMRFHVIPLTDDPAVLKGMANTLQPRVDERRASSAEQSTLAAVQKKLSDLGVPA